MDMNEFLTGCCLGSIGVLSIKFLLLPFIKFLLLQEKSKETETFNISKYDWEMLEAQIKLLERQRENIRNRVVTLEEKVAVLQDQNEQEVDDSLTMCDAEHYKELSLAYFQEVTSLSKHNEDLKQQVQILSKQNAVMQNYIDEHICRRNKSECKNHD